MSQTATKWAYSQRITRPVEKNVLAFIASNCDGQFISPNPVQEISDYTEYLEQDVRLSLEYLLALNFITIESYVDHELLQSYLVISVNINQEYFREPESFVLNLRKEYV